MWNKEASGLSARGRGIYEAKTPEDGAYLSGPGGPDALTEPRVGLRRLLSEPLTHFAILGAILFVCGQLYAARTNTYRIEITAPHVTQLSHKYELQFGRPPDPVTLERLVRDDIHDEILFRQGLALKLEQDDEIVRRRVIQKEQFLLQNLSAPAEPTQAQLATYYAAHRDLYAAPPRVTFSHIYFAVGPGGEAATEARAKLVLGELSAGVTRGPELGDAFPDLYDFSAFEPEQVERLFGHTPLSQVVFSAPVGRWSGPFRSAYGWHLIHVDARVAGGQTPLSEIGDRVRADYLQGAGDRENAAAFNKVARRFTVVRGDVGAHR
jgi:peptidyl-prolyl cis-trans isomerase C